MNTSTVLTLEVQLNPDDIYTFFLWTLLRRFRWILVIAIPLVVAATVVRIALGEWDWSVASLLGPVLLFIFFPYCLFISPYFAARKYLRQNQNVAGTIRYTFSESGMDMSGATFNSHLTWGAILRARETKSQFQIYSQTILANIIPKALLTDSEQVTLRDLLRIHVKDTKLAR